MFTQAYGPDDIAHEQALKNAALHPSRPSTVHLHLATVPLFAECSKRELKLLARTAVIESRAAGATLISEGQIGTNAYVILQGACRVLRNGRRVGRIEAGGVVGELSMLNRAPRNATVIADTTLEVAILARRDFLEVLAQSPSICQKLLVSLAARVQELDARTPG